MYDAIICDPPYGIRAGAKKTGLAQGCDWLDPSKPDAKAPEYGPGFILPLQPYELEDVLSDLMTLAAKTLHVGGRLVYFFPTTNECQPEDLPTHPALEMIADSPQHLTSCWVRRLVTMVKVKEYEPDMKPCVPPARDVPESEGGTSLRAKLLPNNI